MTELPDESVPSYPFKQIELPETATPEQLISALSKRGPLELGHFDFTEFKILESRQTHTTPPQGSGMPIESFTAVLMDTDKGKKIVLFRPMGRMVGGRHGWYYKTYEAK